VVEQLGGLSFLPLPDRGPDRDAFFGQILTGWKRQQFAKNFGASTINRRLASIQAFADFTEKFPWEWTPGDADDYFTHLRQVRGLTVATIRAYQSDVLLFCAYATSDDYPWNETCGRTFGMSMSQVITDQNKSRHRTDSPSSLEKRSFEIDEIQEFFDFADDEVERVVRSKRKGGLEAWRDAVAFKVAYGWGLRHDELRRLRVSDFSASAKAPYFGDYGVLRVRHGKSTAGSPKRQRSVLTLMDWAAEAVADWIDNGLPRLGEPLDLLFPTSSGGVVSKGQLLRRFRSYAAALDLAPGLDIHGLRRSYVTHMITVADYDDKFISMQVGHTNTSTTTIYTLPSADYAAKELERVLTRDVLKSTGKLLRKPSRPSGRKPR
jgi:integrase